MNFYLQYFRHINRLSRRSSTAGFTLTEVLLASIMMLFVILIAGIGVINMLKSNIKANAESEIQGNINRAIEFISDEVKYAKIIAKNPNEVKKAVTNANKIKPNNIPSGSRAVLAFSIPNPNNPAQELQQQVIYYTKAAESYQIGPRVLWRYGPQFNEDGDYVTPDNLASWNSISLVDMLVESAQVTDKECPNGLKRTNYKTPTNDNKVDGFFACVNNKGNLALIRANSEVPIGVYTGEGIQEIPKYSVDTKISTRSGGDFGFKIRSNIVTLTRDASIESESDCESRGEAICKVILSNDRMFNLGTTAPAIAGDEIRISIGSVLSVYSNIPGIQSVAIYTSGQTLPSGINIRLKTNQILYIFNDLRLNETYSVILTIKPR